MADNETANMPAPPRPRFDTINPYRTAARLVATRLLWDLDPESWRSRARLRRLRNSQRGRKAVILCNGPSLLKTDFAMLDGVFTFGLNKINLLFDQSVFRPSCIVAVNPHVIGQNAAFYDETRIPLFIDSWAAKRRLVRRRPGVTFLHTGGHGFARDCRMTVPQGHTVTYVAIQLAFHMGFGAVALVGCDHDFADKGPANALVTGRGPDRNHFHPDYFGQGVAWQLPDLPESEAAYHRARAAFEADGRRIVNATEGGRLEVFERQSLARFLERW